MRTTLQNELHNDTGCQDSDGSTYNRALISKIVASKTPSFAKITSVHYCAYVLCRILAKSLDKCRNCKGKQSFTSRWKVLLLLGRFSRNSRTFNKLCRPSRSIMKKTGKNHLRPFVHYSTASTAPISRNLKWVAYFFGNILCQMLAK